DYQISVAGPSTMAALLNALQMGFRTLAIQKRSGEVWTVLGAVKTEFEKFGAGLQAMQRHLNQTGSDLEELIGTRSRAITRKLEQVQQLDPGEAEDLLGLADAVRPVSRDAGWPGDAGAYTSDPAPVPASAPRLRRRSD